MQLFFPFHLDGRGLAAEATHDEHVRQMIEQVLFTSPGERVNRPDFGCGLLRAIFSMGSAEEIYALQYLLQEALERWLGELIRVQSVELEQDDTTLNVRVAYVELLSEQQRLSTYEVVMP